MPGHRFAEVVKVRAKCPRPFRRLVISVDEQSIRSVIDEIALQVAMCDPQRDELESVIGDKTMEYIDTLRERQPGLSKRELDHIATAIVTNVLRRLVQIAESGSQVGSA